MSNSHRPPDRTRRDSLAKSEQLADRITLVAWRLVKNVSPSHMQQSTACYTLVTYLLTYSAQFTGKPKDACALRFSWAATSSNLGLCEYDVIHKTVST